MDNCGVNLENIVLDSNHKGEQFNTDLITLFGLNSTGYIALIGHTRTPSKSCIGCEYHSNANISQYCTSQIHILQSFPKK